MKKEIYNAGSMFNEGQWNARKIEGVNLRTSFPNMTISNPVDFETNQGNTPTALEIWDADYACVKRSEYIIFELDSLDDGMIMEFALAVEMAKTTQPNKVLIPVVSDFRFYQKSSTTSITELSFNFFVWGAIYDTQLNESKRMWLAKSHAQAIEMIANREKFLETKNKDFLDSNDKLDNKFLYEEKEMFFTK